MKHDLLVRNAYTMLGLLAITASGFPKTPLSPVRITVRVMDYINLPDGDREELERTAHRILAQAGVSIEFVECFNRGVEVAAEACHATLGPTDIILRILQPKMAIKTEQLGYAAMTREGGAYITVFLDPAQQKARVRNLTNGVYMGHAAAHEIGHLLLGANSHSSSGIMRPVWCQADEEWMVKGALLFESGQPRTMRSVLEGRSGLER